MSFINELVTKESTKGRPAWNFLERLALILSDGDPTLQSKRDKWFRSPATIAVRYGISADALSLLGLMFAIFAAFSIGHPLIAGLLLVASLLFDGLDGVVARLTKTSSTRGEILDITCDTVGILVIMLGLVYWEYLAWIYFLLYALILVIYTLVSAVKSKAIIGKYRSIGSRVVVTSYVGVCLAVAQFAPQTVVESGVVTNGVLFIALLLGLNLSWDCLDFLRRTYEHSKVR